MICNIFYSQELSLSITTKDSLSRPLIEKFFTQKRFNSIKEIKDYCLSIQNKAYREGYLSLIFNDLIQIDRANFELECYFGEKTKQIYIEIDEKIGNLLFDGNRQKKIEIAQIENFIGSIISELEKKGFSFAKATLINHKVKNENLYATLKVETNESRIISNINIEGFNKFPKNIFKHLKKTFTYKIYSEDQVKKILNSLESFRFIKTTKPPEILFKKDSTIVYLYLEKNKANRFDGFFGFSNDTGGSIRFNGYLDLQLQNALNTGDKLTFYWRNDGNQQTSFSGIAELPFIFKTPFTIKAQLHIFRQDSTFQNSKTILDLGYPITFNKKIFLGYQSVTSTDIQNQNNNIISDFSSTFFTSSFIFEKFDNDALLFKEKTFLSIKAGIGKRETIVNDLNQFFTQIDLRHLFYLNERNIIALKSENYFLQSSTYVVNELFRFGGINSIRGFNENSLQGNTFLSAISEYRYLVSSSLYLHSILDYGFFQDSTSNLSNRLFSIGFGFGIFTKNGLFNLVYANGTSQNQPIKLNNSIVQLSFKAYF